ncbi:ABC transporter permease [Parafrankia sp. FMc2]|uniref:ABC transporter permease n=1 Tax=Parafrankia sp. FMc2 TaxID=3233196 RepID=UPI0034D58837
MTTAALPSYDLDQRVTQARVLRSEWTKFRSLPSTIWASLAALALVVGFGVLYSTVRVTRPPTDAASLAGFDPTAVSLGGVQLAQIAVGVLGVLAMTGEYGSGAVRTSFAAVPRRLPVLWGKAAVLGAAVLALALPATLVAFLAGQSVLSAEHLDIGLDQPGVARAVIGSAVYLAVIALLGLGTGALLRSTAGALAALFGMLFAVQLIVNFLPASVADSLWKYLPVPAGSAVTFVEPDADSLAPWTGLGVLCCYVTVLLGVAAWRTLSRDV